MLRIIENAQTPIEIMKTEYLRYTSAISRRFGLGFRV